MTQEQNTETMTARKSSVEQFKEFIQGSAIKEDDYDFGWSHDGFTITAKHKNFITKEEVNLVDTFCKATANFDWSIFAPSNKPEKCSFEIGCYY